MKRYRIYGQRPKMTWPRRVVMIITVAILLLVVGMVAVRIYYQTNLRPVSQVTETQQFVVERGATVDEIGRSLESQGLIRSSAVFRWYVSSSKAREALQAGTYELSPSMSVANIVSILTHGKVAADLVTILPGQRIDQIREMLLANGFDEADVDKALDPKTFADHPVLADKPTSASLEGYLFPESLYKTAETKAVDIIESSLDEMNKALTSDIRTAFAGHGLSIYQGVTLASLVEREVDAVDQAGNPIDDRQKVAQVFLKRLGMGMMLQSNATDNFPAAYDTYSIQGLPPGPISNVSKSSLEAVAYPSKTNWVYFVTGNDCKTRFSKVLAEHEALIDRHGVGCQ